MQKRMRQVLSKSKNDLLFDARTVLPIGENHAISAEELAGRLLAVYFGEEYWREAGAPRMVKRLGARLSQFLGEHTVYGAKNREKYGICYKRLEVQGRPLGFYVQDPNKAGEPNTQVNSGQATVTQFSSPQ